MEVEQALDLVMHCSNNVEAGLLLGFRDHLLYIAQQGETHGQQSQIIDCVLQPIYILFCPLCDHSIDCVSILHRVSI